MLRENQSLSERCVPKPVNHEEPRAGRDPSGILGKLTFSNTTDKSGITLGWLVITIWLAILSFIPQ